MDIALARALRVEGKTAQEEFKDLGWGLRTWDQWNNNYKLVLSFKRFSFPDTLAELASIYHNIPFGKRILFFQ